MQLNSLSPITIIGFGTPTGGHRAVELLKDGTFSIRTAPNGGGKYKTFTTNPDGSQLKLQKHQSTLIPVSVLGLKLL